MKTKGFHYLRKLQSGVYIEACYQIQSYGTYSSCQLYKVRYPTTCPLHVVDEVIARDERSTRYVGLGFQTLKRCPTFNERRIQEIFSVWLNILRRVPRSVLWLLRFPAAGEEHIRRTAKSWAGEDVASRVIFTDVTSKELHISRSRVVDLFLDTIEVSRMIFSW